MRNTAYKALDAVVPTADRTSLALKTAGASKVSMSAEWSGGETVGNVLLQVSNDGTNWFTVTDLDDADIAIAVSGTSGTGYVAAYEVIGKFVRAFYDRTSDGTGATLDVIVYVC